MPDPKDTEQGGGTWARRVNDPRFLLSVALAALAVATAAAATLLSGPLPVAQQDFPLPQSDTASSAPGDAPTPRPTFVRQETYGDWTYSCAEVPPDKEIRCSIAQQISEAGSATVIFIWRIAQDGRGGLMGIWQTPQTVQLSRGVTLGAGTREPVAIPFDTCGNWGCQAVAPLAPGDLDSLAATGTAAATIVMNDGRALTLTLSLDGLDEGLAALRRSPPP